MSEPITIIVYGKPQTAGSKKAFGFKRANGSIGASVTDDNAKSRDWKNAVASAAREVYDGDLLRGPLKVMMTFVMVRPKGHHGKMGPTKQGRETPFPVGRPDVLKLSRCVEDALSGVVWADDAQIVHETLVKLYGEPARAFVTIERLGA